ncbi:MAG: Vi polysaccharide biosynthesis protein VipB/TviC [Planctomycetes bacterium SM23_32]|nr:MAG: Vi polysaccharide biosynthesis protein VipB/TviC [Planctomycetes bacterium SM23_32]
MSVYVVTGGAGFIGSAIARRLTAAGEAVRVLDDFSTGRRDNLAGVQRDVTLFEGSVCDPELVREALDGADCVLHQAAQVSVPLSVEDPVHTNEVNVGGTLNVLTAARELGVRRVVFASSCAVYGDAPQLPKREDMPPAPKSPYAASKLAGEHYCRAFNDGLGPEAVSLRYFNVFGPYQDTESQYAAVVPIFIRSIMLSRRPVVHGDGEQTRDFVFVDDVVEANLLAATSPKAAGAVLNIGSGERRSLNELLSTLAELMGTPADADYADERPGDVRHSQADISLARKTIGFRPLVGFAEGLSRAVEWYQGKEDTTFFLPDAPEH